MRVSILAAVPLLAALSAVPAAGQVSARLHLDIPIGRRPVVAYPGPRRPLVIRDYDSQLFGDWDNYYDEWLPETVYLYDGYYYDYPIVSYAQPIVVYRYRNQVFFAPRQREFIQWRDQRGFRDIGRSRPIVRNDFRGYSRDGGYYRAPQEWRGGGRDVRPAPQQGGRDGRDARPAPQQGGRQGDQRPAPQGDRGNPRSQGGGDRSRPHGGH